MIYILEWREYFAKNKNIISNALFYSTCEDLFTFFRQAKALVIVWLL